MEVERGSLDKEVGKKESLSALKKATGLRIMDRDYEIFQFLFESGFGRGPGQSLGGRSPETGTRLHACYCGFRNKLISI